MMKNTKSMTRAAAKGVSLSNACQSKAQNCLSHFDVMLCGM
jgi:hypothetical protein